MSNVFILGQGANLALLLLGDFMYDKALNNPSNILDIYRRHKYLVEFSKSHPGYFQPIGTLIFCGKQGAGKTLSAVLYARNVLNDFPLAILCTNIKMAEFPFNTRYEYNSESDETVYYNLSSGEKLDRTMDGTLFHPDGYICIEWDGLDCLKYISNGFFGVLYVVDELHLELNSLESKNIDIDVMTEISQQRKQRKHIVGTSQVYMRLAKPLREQIFDIVLCSKFFGFLQYNKYIDGEESKEVDGKLQAVVKKRVFWIHKPEYYDLYDTFAKMKRLNKEWNGHKREAPTFDFVVRKG